MYLAVFEQHAQLLQNNQKIKNFLPHQNLLKLTPYYFCASGCLKKFKLDPGKYV